MEERLYGLCE